MSKGAIKCEICNAILIEDSKEMYYHYKIHQIKLALGIDNPTLNKDKDNKKKSKKIEQKSDLIGFHMEEQVNEEEL